MIANILDAAIILLLTILVAVPATIAISRTLRQRAARRRRSNLAPDRAVRRTG